MSQNKKHITKIILVEDDDSNSLLIKRMLERAEVTQEIILFDNGFEFLSYISENIHSGEKYLVLLDLNLPVLNGFQILEKLRNIASMDKLPVYVMSTTVRRSDVEQAYSSGCTNFLRKPITYDNLINKIQQNGLILNEGVFV